jgi:hypothetical protein
VTDRYTKTVLTVIAACLVVLTFRVAATQTAIAQSSPVHVVVDQIDQYAFQYVKMKVTLSQVDQYAFQYATVPVHVEP